MHSKEFVENKKCPFCNSLNISRYQQRVDQVWVLLCDNCNLGFIEKYPRDLKEIYELEYYEKPTKSETEHEIGYDDYSQIDSSYFLWCIALVGLVKAKGSIFDLGCSNGLFLDLAKQYGFSYLSGVEYNDEYATICNQKGYKVYNQSFINIDFDQDEKFDVITAWAVLEHIPELNDVFHKIKTILKTTGFLFFEVPCLTFNEKADKYWFTTSLEHIYYFTEDSFRKITSHFFGQEYVGRVVDFENFGSTIIGFVSSDKSEIDKLRYLASCLNSITEEDFGKLCTQDLLNYLIFYFKYTNNLDSSQAIANYLVNTSNLNISDYFNIFLVEKYIREHKDNIEYIQAKEYFISQIRYAKIELEKCQLQQQQTQAELECSQAKQQQTQAELERSLVQQQQTQAELERSLVQQQQTQTELEFSQTQLQQAQIELERLQAHSQLQAKALEFSQTQIELERLQVQLQEAQKSLRAIETSKFWKLRSLWFRFRKYIGITDDTESITLKALLNFVKPKYKTISISQKEWSQNKPLVSVIIPCFNYGQYVEEAIDSVLNQRFQNFEIIVIDDGSDDPATIEVLNNLVKPKTRIIRQTNQKLPQTRNNGIKLAKGKYICCLDADDQLHPTYLEKCLVKLETENLDIAYSWIQEFEDRDFIWKTGDFNIDTLIHQNCVAVSAVFKRSIWSKTGGYPRMNQGYEDWCFWIAIAKVGGLGAKIDEPLFLYRKHGYSMIDAAVEKHHTLYEEIKNIHQELYENPNNIDKIKQKQVKFVVQNAYINLLNSFKWNYQGKQANTENTNILFALPWLVTGGTDTVILQLISYLQQNNCKIAVCTTEKPSVEMGDNTAKFEKLTKDVYHLYNFLEPYMWKEYIFYIIESRQIDIIFLAGSNFIYSILPEIKKQFPHIKIIDQLYNQYGHIDNNRKYAEYIDIHIVENESVECCLINEHGEQQDQVILIHNGVNTDYFNPNLAIELSIHDKIISKNKFIVSFLGRFSYEKAPDLFVEIVNKLRDDDNFYFVMAGNGLMYSEIIELIHKYELNDKIYLPGFVDTREYLSFSNVVVIPSRIDGRPNVALESLSMGVPVVATSVGGLPTIIKNEYNGILCEMENIDNFVEAIKNLRVQNEYFQNLKANARDYAINNLSITKMSEKYLDIITSLVKSE